MTSYLQVCDERDTGIDRRSPYKVIVLDVLCVLIGQVDDKVHDFVLDQSTTYKHHMMKTSCERPKHNDE